jgi:uncharacterized lipoprotein YehR (DUF1307 family)
VKNLLVVVLVSCLVLTFVGCKKKEEKAQQPLPGPSSMQGGMPMTMSGMQKQERVVIVSKEVKAKWSAVKLLIADKTLRTEHEYIVGVGSDLAIPNTTVTIHVLVFLPDFKMTDQNITSASNKPNNPAAQVRIRELGKQEWKGWLFASHSDIHPFPHDKISLRLMGGVTQ